MLAVGNTLADYFANSSLAAMGYGVMACTGSMAGQVFNFLIGFGCNTLKMTWTRTKMDFELLNFGTDRPAKIFTLMIIGFLMLYLASMVINSYLSE